MEIRWCGHLVLPEFDNQTRPTPAFIREKLEELRQGVAEYTIPEFPPGRLIEMSCFDPNRCQCLYYPGQEALLNRWPLSLKSEKDATGDWRKSAKLPPFEIRPEGVEGKGETPTATQQCGCHYTFTTTVDPSPFQGDTGFVGVSIIPCGRTCLRVQYTRSITIIPSSIPPQSAPTGEITSTWIQAIHPDSYNLVQDEETSGILWCQTLGCRNYYKYLNMSRQFPGECPRSFGQEDMQQLKQGIRVEDYPDY
ncbi:hypothetical protein F4780DRAFT_780594 [Xylariomycetidae sp. FL0641]|nr:hypothetical protein F4780DRAFT_780594 [Xylariomycetidae sp. FL0641]